MIRVINVVTVLLVVRRGNAEQHLRGATWAEHLNTPGLRKLKMSMGTPKDSTEDGNEPPVATTPAPLPTTTADNRDDTGGVTNPPLPPVSSGACEICSLLCADCGNSQLPECTNVCNIATSSDCEAQCQVLLYGPPGDIRDDPVTNPPLQPDDPPDYCSECIRQCDYCEANGIKSRNCETLCNIAVASNCDSWCQETLHLPWGSNP